MVCLFHKATIIIDEVVIHVRYSDGQQGVFIDSSPNF